MENLTPAERRALKARAHHLQPVVIIGDAGLTPAVLGEIDRALTSHEL
ncbi:MAG: YhbY family RNA-binding protein, partial [Betaproteobacteria bacterium]|nr:YhbY family RNA-binding protein [Betaproteobacteria bacterium]